MIDTDEQLPVAVLHVREDETSASYHIDELSAVPIGSHALYLNPRDKLDSDFIKDLKRSIKKYPGNARMFDALMGEMEELRRAYDGDGSVRDEAFDVAACAYRIATEGDAGGNVTISSVFGRMSGSALARVKKLELENSTLKERIAELEGFTGWQR